MPAFNKTTILGTGTMGPGMGAVLERAGSETHLFDISPEALEKAAPLIGQHTKQISEEFSL